MADKYIGLGFFQPWTVYTGRPKYLYILLVHESGTIYRSM